MKKVFVFFLSATIIALTSLQVYANNLIILNEESYAPTINYTQHSFIESDYYKLYYNELFEHRYKKIQKSSTDSEENYNDYSYLYSLLKKDSYTYITVIFYDKPENIEYYTYNTENLSLTFPKEDILYVGNTTPMAVVKLEYDKIASLKENKKIQYITNAFFNTAKIINFIYGGQKMGNVLSNNDVTAEDARFVLRFTAGLENVDMYSAKKFYFVADMNTDGSISSADARLILRTAAKLEAQKEIAFPYAAYWNDFA